MTMLVDCPMLQHSFSFQRKNSSLWTATGFWTSRSSRASSNSKRKLLDCIQIKDRKVCAYISLPCLSFLFRGKCVFFLLDVLAEAAQFKRIFERLMIILIRNKVKFNNRPLLIRLIGQECHIWKSFWLENSLHEAFCRLTLWHATIVWCGWLLSSTNSLVQSSISPR